MQQSLPITPVLPEISQHLETSDLVILSAPPGAGKTTTVPLHLLCACRLNGKKIIMLEPRRLAARMAARFMAKSLGEKPGQTVGYQMRGDTKVGENTRIIVMTEGVLTRKIQSDPELSDIGIVIFDEFHERHLHADLGLALCLEIKDVLRDDLRLLIMSATLDVTALSQFLPEASIIKATGQSFPVDIIYSEQRPQRSKFDHLNQVCKSVLRARNETDGDILVFLPGIFEIRYLSSMLADTIKDHGMIIYSLFGGMPEKEQDLVVTPDPKKRRKIILSTAIAETAVTIHGVRAVVDSGLMRLAKYSSATGMTRLETRQISTDVATQRAGRAGRTAPGKCYRLWQKGTHLVPSSPPEIVTADLTSLVLEIAAWGAGKPDDLKWIDTPPETAFIKAKKILIQLGALDSDGRITETGKQMVRIGAHPRLARIMLEGKKTKALKLATTIAALLEERDILKNENPDADIVSRIRVALLAPQASGIHKNRLKRVLLTATAWEKKLGNKNSAISLNNTAEALISGYPDRIARAVKGPTAGTFRLISGNRVYVNPSDPIAKAEWIVAVQTDGKRSGARVFLGAACDTAFVRHFFKDQIVTTRKISWDDDQGKVVASEISALGEITLCEKPIQNPDKHLVETALLEAVRKRGVQVLPWTKKAISVCERIEFIRRVDPESTLPDMSEAGLIQKIEAWLGPFISGIRQLNALKSIDLYQALASRLSWQEKQLVETMAPTHLKVPTGHHRPLNYGRPDGSPCDAPVLAVKIQELFGLTKTPEVAGGRIPVILHLLSPAGRPMQVTQDLESFWENGYPMVKKDLKGRYPKHPWPDDPKNAPPTSKTKAKK